MLLLINSCGDKKNKITPDSRKPAPPPPMVDVFIVKKSAVSEKLVFPGTLLAFDAAELHPEVSGRLTYLNVPEGKAVKAGTLIAKIYDGDLKAQLSKLKVQLQVAEQTARRYEELLKINGVSRQEYDLKQLEISNIKADMEIVQSNLRRTEIRAPFTGIMGLKMTSAGAFVSPSTLISTIREQDRLRIEFSVPERHMEKIRVGREAEFSVEGSDRIYRARIDATEAGVSAENRSLTVRADVVKGDRELTAGSFVEVTLSLEPDTAALMVPSQAVLPQARGKRIALVKNGAVSFANIETGIRDTSMVQVTKGISSGDTVILTGLMGLKPDASIRIGKIRE